ncbi:MAG: DUF1700 domain-containing protein [Oscillibacter sp.]|nr:DUF1700 domain-containing protein [Oscillibacter sp.]
MKWSRKPVATWQAWLDELGRRLVWFFPADQVKDIVSDYQEQFEAGHDHHRTEPEIILGLGTPAEAAALLLEEEPSARLNCLRHSVTWGAALAVCCAFIWAFLNSVGTLVTLPLTASVLFLLLRGPARVELEVPAEKNISPIPGYYVPFVLMLLFEAAEQIMVALGERLPRSIAGMSIGEANTWAILYLEAAIAALAVWLLYRSVTTSVRYFPGFIHVAGTGASVFLTYACFTVLHFDTLFSLPFDMLLSLLPYCAGLVTALVFQRWTDGRRPLPRFFRDREVSWQDWRHRLSGSLLGWFPVEQTLEVLEDYQEQYELGREQGKAEEALLREMGRPETVVRDLLAEDRKARLNRRKTRLWAVLAAVSGWLLLGLLRSFEFGGVGFGRFYDQFSLQISLLSVVLGTVSLFFLLHVRERAAVERRFPIAGKPGCLLLLLPLAASALVESLALWGICNALDYQIPVLWGKPVTWFIIRSIEFSTLLLTLLLIRTLDRCVSGSIRHFPAVPLLTGSMAHILCVGLYLSRMDLEYIREDLAGTIRVNLTAVFPLLAGLVLSVALWLVLRAAGKKEG